MHAERVGVRRERESDGERKSEGSREGERVREGEKTGDVYKCTLAK